MDKFTLKQLRKLGTEEMLMSELVGKIAERIALPSHEMPFYRKKQQWVNAGNLVVQYIATGDVILRKVTEEHEGKFKTLNKVRITNPLKAPVSSLRGFEGTPSQCYTKSVRNSRLRHQDLATLKLAASIKFYRSEFCTDAYISRIHELLPKDSKSMELEWKRQGRLNGYKKTILAMDSMYLPMKPDGRGRMYYEGASLEGFRPHGKCYESHAFELASRELSVEGKEVLSNLHLKPIELSAATTKEQILSCLRIPQVTKALDTNETGMTVECDVTNSGLLIAGLGFKSPEMLMATNGYGNTEVADSHTVFGNAYGLDRDMAKKVHTPLLHGASNKSIAKKLTEITGEEFTTEDVRVGNEKAYGKAAENINTIARYGREVMSNYRSEVSWDMPDGFRATHRAYTVHVPLELQLTGRKLKVMSSMPLLLDGRGNPVYDSNTPGAHEKTATKMMGLYADIIHSIDGYVMRCVINSRIELLAKHDAFLIHPNDVSLLKTTLQGIYSDIFDMDLIRNILSQIEASTGVPAPEMFIGEAVDKMAESFLFVSVE